ncbi:MAG: CopG family ribbon-helix-helix protein [Alphaproteobacteria bacterium]|nr:CopG family ribbon-helix-helix protein [Alphaproteobacteria bacterium]
MPVTVPVTVRISPEVNEQLERLAEATSRSKSLLAAEAIGAFVQTESQFVDAVEEGRRAVREGRVVSHHEVRKWLESWGSDAELPPPIE